MIKIIAVVQKHFDYSNGTFSEQNVKMSCWCLCKPSSSSYFFSLNSCFLAKFKTRIKPLNVALQNFQFSFEWLCKTPGFHAQTQQLAHIYTSPQTFIWVVANHLVQQTTCTCRCSNRGDKLRYLLFRSFCCILSLSNSLLFALSWTLCVYLRIIFC